MIGWFYGRSTQKGYMASIKIYKQIDQLKNKVTKMLRMECLKSKELSSHFLWDQLTVYNKTKIQMVYLFKARCKVEIIREVNAQSLHEHIPEM